MMSRTTVIVRGLEIGAGMPKIAVPLTAQNAEQLPAAIARACAAPADLIEYRADYDSAVMQGGETLRSALQLIREGIGDKPLLFTIRTAAEGGEADIAFDRYAALCSEAAASGLVDLVDVELFTAAAGCGDGIRAFISGLQNMGIKIIGSSHDFRKTPETAELLHRVRAMQDAGMDITKIAVMPQTRRDVIRLLDAALRIEEEAADRPCITMSMGPMGTVSRISGSLTGSAVTFGTAGEASAPGQLPAEQLRDFLGALEM